MDTETSMMSIAADELLKASFSRIKIMDRYKDQLTYLSELEQLKPKYNRRGCVNAFSNRSSLSCPEITESLEKLQKIEGEINEAQQKNKELLENLKISANSDEHVVEEILSATARVHGLKGQINFNSASAQQLIQKVHKSEFQHILEGKVVVGVVDGGMELPLPEVIQTLTELIWKNHVTEASKSLKAAADKINEFIWALILQFNNNVRFLETIATQKHEEQPAREADTQQVCKKRSGQMSNLDISVPSEDTTTDAPQGQKSCAESQTHQTNEDEQEGPPPEERRGQEEGESVQNAQIGGDQPQVRNAMMYGKNEECYQGSEESYSEEAEDGDSWHLSPEDISDPDERYDFYWDSVQRLAAANRDNAKHWALLNCRSINKKPIRELLTVYNLQVFILTETWLQRGNGDHVLQTYLPNTYSFFHWMREEGHRGGVAIIFSNWWLQGQRIYFNSTTAFEHVAAELRHADWAQPVLVVGVYRPPTTSNDEFKQFVIELQSLLTTAKRTYSNIILAGDFNVWVDVNRPNTRRFIELLNGNSLVQYVREPTHERGHTLDLVISSRNIEITDLMVQRDTPSDHSTVYFQCNAKTRRKRRNLKHKTTEKQ